MNLEKWALISEIIGGIAIVISIVFLVFEVRDNTRAVQAASRQSIAARVEQIALTVATDDELPALLADPHAVELSPADDIKLRSFLTVLLRNSEEAFLQVQDGNLEEEYFRSRIQGVLRFIVSGAGARIYSDQKVNSVYNREFTDRLDQEIRDRYGN